MKIGNKFALSVLLILLMSSCATHQAEMDPDGTRGANNEDLDRQFNPCLINPKLAVCRESNVPTEK